MVDAWFLYHRLLTLLMFLGHHSLIFYANCVIMNSAENILDDSENKASGDRSSVAAHLSTSQV